jgi:hypothetical protein
VGKLAFLGDTLEVFRFAFNAVLQLTGLGRQQPNDFVWSTGCPLARSGGREINELADLEFGLTKKWAMEKAKRARKAETPKQPSLCLKLRAPYFYPDSLPALLRRSSAGIDCRIMRSMSCNWSRSLASHSEMAAPVAPARAAAGVDPDCSQWLGALDLH